MSFTFSEWNLWWCKECLEVRGVLLVPVGAFLICDLGKIIGVATTGVAKEETLLLGGRDRRCGVT